MAGIAARIGDWMAARIASYLDSPQAKEVQGLQGYYNGKQRPQLRVKEGQANDNIMLNWVGLAVDRAVSMLLGTGVEFALPEENEQQQEYLNQVWDINKRSILLQSIALDGAVSGHIFLKILPDALVSNYTDEVFPRLVLIDPKLITKHVDPRDMSQVQKYVMEYKLKDGIDKEHLFREVTRRATPEDFDTPQEEVSQWIIETLEYINGWRVIDSVNWPYPFPPIHDWKNLPTIHSARGSSDIDQVIDAQDKYNFVQSNNLKINRYHAHPKTWGSGFTKTDKTSWGADEMITISDVNGKISNLEMSSDLAASRAIGLDLRQAIFDIAREVDITSITDKIGQLTNFGLRLLFSDALSKVSTKRELYSEGLNEINRRVLVLKGWEKELSNPGEVVWSEPLPINLIEEIAIDKEALALGIVDKQTVSERYVKRYGQDWETILQRMNEQKASERTVGSMLLQNFNRGQ